MRNLKGLVLIAAVLVAGCIPPGDPTWTLYVRNDSADTYLLRWFPSGEAVVFELAPGQMGYLASGSPPGPAIDLLLTSCDYVMSRRVIDTGSSVAVISNGPGFEIATAPSQRDAPQLKPSPDLCASP